MVKLHTRIGEKHLLNVPGRLSDCGPCCCDEAVDRDWYLHVVPTGLDEFGATNTDCQSLDESEVEANPEPLINFDVDPTEEFNHCLDWVTDNSGKGTQACYNGQPMQPVTQFGVGVNLRCTYQDQFSLEICWGVTSQPNYPTSTGGCLLLQEVDSVSSTACTAPPGEAVIDFGNIIPNYGTASPCYCSFHVYIDETASLLDQSDRPVYWYPAEAAGGRPDHFGPLWWAETQPGVGTPQRPRKPPRTPPVGVGTRIARMLALLRIRYEEDSGCQCYRLMREMNAAGPVRIMADFEVWVERMRASSKQWFHVKMGQGPRGWLVQPLRPLRHRTIPALIKRACRAEAKHLGVSL